MSEMLQDRVPPQSIEAEQATLGSIFLETDALITAMEYIVPEDFYRRGHQLIFRGMIQLNDRNEAIDVVTVKELLEQQNQLEDAGGLSYLSELALSVPTAANVGYYAKIVEEKSLLRNLLNTAIENIDQLARNDEEITGLPTGYAALDKMTAGLQAEELIILAARPAVGKTAFALNIAQNVGTKTDKAVAIFSLEMGAESLVNRMLCSEGSIEASHLRTGQLSEEEWQNLIVAMGSLSRANIYVDDTPGIKVSEIRAKCHKLAKEKGNLGLILIDYLQLIEGTGRENRQQEVSEISRQLKKLAKELKVPIIALSQLSRGVEQRQDKRPVLSDIRESGSIEQDADIVAFLYRDDYYDREGEEEEESLANRNVIEVIIEKNRSGARGTVELLFIKEYNKFSSLSPREDF